MQWVASRNSPSTHRHIYPMSTDSTIADTFAILTRLRARAPRVQCLTNTVAQPITANVLLAAGARVSMAVHPDEVVDMTASADALLINLGTIDAARITAIPQLLADPRILVLPRVLDPVFVEHSPLRLALAHQVIAAGPTLVKGNVAELTALALPPDTIGVQTGATDRVFGNGRTVTIANGHPWMADVTGLGCALGALIAGCRAVEPDPIKAATAAVLAFGVAGEVAAARAGGPGTFAAAFIDAISQLDQRTLADKARVKHRAA